MQHFLVGAILALVSTEEVYDVVVESLERFHLLEVSFHLLHDTELDLLLALILLLSE